jgi:hypothetical protein
MRSLWSESAPHKNQNLQCSQKFNAKITGNASSYFWKLRGARLNKKTNKGHLPTKPMLFLRVPDRSKKFSRNLPKAL